MHKRKVLGLAFSNFFFYGSYAFVGYNALFLYPSSVYPDLRDVIILGLGLFAGLQVGGVWLLSFFGERWTKDVNLMLFLRFGALALIVVPNPICQFLSFFSFGVSQAIYYKKSRSLLGDYVKKYSGKINLFVLFGITTNVSFMIFPVMGAFILQQDLAKLMILALGGFMASSAFVLYDEKKSGNNLLGEEEASKQDFQPEPYKPKEFIVDMLRFLGFVLPYGIMISIIPIKASAIGLDARYNSLLLGFNPLAVVILQTLSLKLPILQFNLKIYDLISIIAVLCCVGMMLSNFWLGIPFFILWSLCEAYQLPNIDYYLFSYKTIEGKFINRILAFDAVICIGGPIIAAQSISLLGMKAIEDPIRNVTTWLVKLIF